ncbi:MAG: hypothetical protein LBS01_06945 [Prevotellaceae bacterium]|jgi:hypothetical protein|nr:hypothetical protein [Prevotellaceae bacterium]
MKKSILILGFSALMSGAALTAQVGVNTETPKMTLDVVAGKTDASTAEGFAAPRLKLSELNAKQAKYTADHTQAQWCMLPQLTRRLSAIIQTR